MTHKSDKAKPAASQSEINEFLKRHGIEPTDFPAICDLIHEANDLTRDKRRNYYGTPVYKCEIRYGKWLYQIGPTGCVTALTEAQAQRLWQITRQLNELLNSFPYDPENMFVEIACTLHGTCRRCDLSLKGMVHLTHEAADNTRTTGHYELPGYRF